MNQSIEIFDVLARAWGCLARHFGLMLAVTLIDVAIILVLGMIPGLNVVYQLFIHFALNGGLTIFFLKAIRDGDPQIGDMFAGFRNYITWEAIGLLRGLVFSAASLPAFLVIGSLGILRRPMRIPVPQGLSPDDLPFDLPSTIPPHMYITIGVGVVVSLLIIGYFGLRWLYVMPAAADGAGIMEAFGQSAQLTRGRFTQLSLIYLGFGIMVLLGSAVFCVGAVVAGILTDIAHVMIYDDLRRGRAQAGARYAPSEYAPRQQSGPVTQLAATAGPHAGQVFALASNPVVIGREPQCGVQLVQDMMISRQHARLVWDGTAWVLEDLGSTNGVYLNGQRVTTARLSPGDQIFLGQTQLTAQ
jgi:uncharacterized membrane protein